MKRQLPTVSLGGKTFPLGYGLVASLALEQDPELLAELATHPSASVRAAVADNSEAPPEVLDILFATTEHKVLMALLGNDAFQRFGAYDTAALWALCERDAELAQAVARNVERFAKADLRVIADKLAGHPDPEVREALASNSGLPRALVKRLLQDEDPTVVRYARSALGR